MKDILALALATAEHFGHEWAKVLAETKKTDEFLAASRRSTAFAVIEDAFAASQDADLRGIPYPELGWFETSHTTASGRIQVRGTAEKFTVNAFAADGCEIIAQACITRSGDTWQAVPLAVSTTRHAGHVGMVWGTVQGILCALGGGKGYIYAPVGIDVPQQKDLSVDAEEVLGSANNLFAYLED